MDKILVKLLKLKGIESVMLVAGILWRTYCLERLICVHVDDFWVAVSEHFRVEVVNKLANVFLIGEVKSIPCHYLGLGIRRDGGEIIIDLADYVKNKLTEVPIESDRVQRKSNLLTDCERNDLRIVLGKLQWLATQSDPTLCFTVSSLCGKIATATIADAFNTNKIIRRLKNGREITLRFKKLGTVDSWKLLSYSDASLANLDDGGTQGGFINLVSNDVSCALLVWQSHEIRRIVRSTLAAKTIACIDGADSAFLLASQIQEITGHRTPIICISDCKSLVSAVKIT